MSIDNMFGPAELTAEDRALVATWVPKVIKDAPTIQELSERYSRTHRPFYTEYISSIFAFAAQEQSSPDPSGVDAVRKLIEDHLTGPDLSLVSGRDAGGSEGAEMSKQQVMESITSSANEAKARQSDAIREMVGDILVSPPPPLNGLLLVSLQWQSITKREAMMMTLVDEVVAEAAAQAESSKLGSALAGDVEDLIRHTISAHTQHALGLLV